MVVVAAASVKRWRRGLLLAVALGGAVAAACGLGGPGGSAALGYSVDLDDPERPILVEVVGAVKVGQEIFIRLEVNELLDATFVLVRIQNDTGQGFLEIDEFRFPVAPPWRIAIIPLRLSQPGKWNLALIANSRKITDVELETER